VSNAGNRVLKPLLTISQGNVNPAAAAGKCAFEAGDTVTIEMHQHNDRLCATEGIGGAHWGPVLAYMGKVEDAASADGSGEFFKVYQNGWKKNPAASQGDADFWGTKDLNYNCKPFVSRPWNDTNIT
jgi:cellulase